MKNTAARQRIYGELEKAEAAGRCLVPANQADRVFLGRAVAKGVVVRPFAGMYMFASSWEALEKAPRRQWRFVQNTYIDLHPEEILCSFSAALDYGLWVSKKQLGVIHLAICDASHGYRSSAIHRHSCPYSEIDTSGPIVRTTLERTLLDCTCSCSFSEGLALVDSAMRFCKLDSHEYREYLASAGRNRTGVNKALCVARFMDGRSESGGESIVRAKIIELGFLPPTMLQAEFVDPIDGGLIRADMYYELESGFRLIVEVDGLGKYLGSNGLGIDMQKRLLAERQRESHISALGIPVMRVQFGRVYEKGYLEHLLESFGVPRTAES